MGNIDLPFVLLEMREFQALDDPLRNSLPQGL